MGLPLGGGGAANADEIFGSLRLISPDRRKKLLQEYYEQHHGNRTIEDFKDEKKVRFFQSKLSALGVDPGGQAIDLGCRGGVLTKHLENFGHWCGVDIDRNAIEYANKLGIPCCEMDISSAIDFKDDCFSIVVMTEVMEHLPHPPITVREVHRILRKDGGVFMGSVPLDYHLHRRWSVMRGRRLEGDPTHIHHFSYTELDNLLRHYFDKVDYMPLRGTIAKKPWLLGMFGGKFQRQFLQGWVRDIAWVASQPKLVAPFWKIEVHH
jgi:SAM-dependent methyltransferase